MKKIYRYQIPIGVNDKNDDDDDDEYIIVNPVALCLVCSTRQVILQRGQYEKKNTIRFYVTFGS